MAQTIFKYELALGEVDLQLPRGTVILSIQNQRAILCLWAQVDETQPLEQRSFLILGTGHEIPTNRELRYINTVQMESGLLVWHVFEILRRLE